MFDVFNNNIVRDRRKTQNNVSMWSILHSIWRMEEV